MNVNDMKEPILAITKQGLAGLNLVQGFNPMDWEEFQGGIDPATLLVGERALLEVDFDKRHFIPYLLINNDRKFFAYQRGKGVGESRLAGNDSCGLGGHTDRADVVYADPEETVIDLRLSLNKAADRELAEELEGGVDRPHFVGLLIDDANEVGQVHIGVVYAVEAYDRDQDYTCKEAALQALGFFTPQELLARPKLENWSQIMMNHVAQLEAQRTHDGEDSACDQLAEQAGD